MTKWQTIVVNEETEGRVTDPTSSLEEILSGRSHRYPSNGRWTKRGLLASINTSPSKLNRAITLEHIKNSVTYMMIGDTIFTYMPQICKYTATLAKRDKQINTNRL